MRIDVDLRRYAPSAHQPAICAEPPNNSVERDRPQAVLVDSYRGFAAVAPLTSEVGPPYLSSMNYSLRLFKMRHKYPLVRNFMVSLVAVACSVITMAQAQTPFSVAFPPNFKGEDCDAIATVLRESQTKKDEFENIASYENRLEGILNAKTVSDRPLSESKFFINSDRISSTYDADKGLMKVYGSLRQSTKVSESIRYARTVVVNTRSARASEYQGQNSFSASTTVKKYRDEICGVAFLNVSPVTDLEWMGIIEFPLSAEVARQSKGNVTLVYQARLAPPLVVDYRQYIAPTLSSPSDILVQGDALTAVLERYFLINKATGEVLFERAYTPK